MKLITLPEKNLQELLAKAEPGVSVQIYLKRSSVISNLKTALFFTKRTAVAKWSAIFLVAACFISLLSFLLEPDFEGFIILACLAGLSYVEYETFNLFKAADIKARLWGGYNQTVFAGLILLYGLYHASFNEVLPSSFTSEVDPSLTLGIQALTKVFYLIIGFVGAISQGLLARYYFQDIE